MAKYVYDFCEGNKDLKDLLGGKGANLAEMFSMNIPVPNGFTVTTLVCKKYYDDNNKLNKHVRKQITNKLKKLEKKTGKEFGSLSNPLLISVRSGAKVSMPGMMDTVINLGLNEEIIKSLVKLGIDRRFLLDLYRRFIMLFSEVVKNISHDKLSKIIDREKEKYNIKYDRDFSEENLENIIFSMKKLYLKETGKNFSNNVKQQLFECICAVFDSWNNERALYYRKINNISSDLGTAVNIQQMVYGNYNDKSATGVLFSRNPVNGNNELYGEYLINAQGEDIVSGTRTPKSINELKNDFPKCYVQLGKIAKNLEKHYKDMQDMEFTIEDDKLYILQTRSGKRTSNSSIRIALDLLNEKIVSKEEAVFLVSEKDISAFLYKNFDANQLKSAEIIGKGLAASPGTASGRICFNTNNIKKDESYILVKEETLSSDIESMNIVQGVLTKKGGSTSHAAVVARSLGICCVTGCENLNIDLKSKSVSFDNGVCLKEGDFISIDGFTGNIYLDILDQVDSKKDKAFDYFLGILDNYNESMIVKANVDSPVEAELAESFNSNGIGLCRTEHMFFESERILELRKVLISLLSNEDVSLNKIYNYQKKDFIDIFKHMDDQEVTIRLLDPPLHEFLPRTLDEIKELAKASSKSEKEIKDIISSLEEHNPMLGHRGSRLGVSYPIIIKTQVEAIIMACVSSTRKGIDVVPKIMLPLISDVNEFIYLKNIIRDEITKILEKEDIKIKYYIGSMVETPRACLIMDDLAKEVDFISFGTNDLTQMTYGLSRDDFSSFIGDYNRIGIFNDNPFSILDTKGVGYLMKHAVNVSRKINSKMDIGICGEHACNQKAIEFCYNNGFDYVSCNPYKIPVAKLIIAKLEIKKRITLK